MGIRQVIHCSIVPDAVSFSSIRYILDECHSNLFIHIPGEANSHHSDSLVIFQFIDLSLLWYISTVSDDGAILTIQEVIPFGVMMIIPFSI